MSASDQRSSEQPKATNTTVAESVELSDGTEISLKAHVRAELPERPRSSWSILTITTLAVLAALYFTRELLVPLVFAALLALLFRPLLRRMKKWNLPNGVSALILIGAVVVVFVIGIWGLAGQAQEWLKGAPETIRSVKGMLPQGIGPMQDLKETGKAVGELTEGEEGEEGQSSSKASETSRAEEGTEQPPAENGAAAAFARDWVPAFIGTSSYIIGASIIVFVVAYFLLALSDQLTRQAVGMMPTFYEKRNVVEVIHNVEQGVSRYLATIAVINVGLGVVTALAMWALKLPNPILWGVMAFALNSVPHIGAFICMVVLFFVGAIAHESLAWGFAAAGAFALITSAESYFITPMVLSKRLELSPLMVILFILFWSWMWGAGGALLAAPLLAVAKIVCDQFESLHPLAAILGGTSPPGNDSTPANTNNPAKAAA